MSLLLSIILGIGQANAYYNDSRVKIAVIDSGLNVSPELKPYLCASGHTSLVDGNPMKDSTTTQHGTNVVGLITKGLDSSKYCVIIIKFYSPTYQGSNKQDKIADSVAHALIYKARYINISATGKGYLGYEARALKVALASGATIAVAAGNEHLDLNKKCNTYPACYAALLNSKRFHVVGSYSGEFSNQGFIVTHKENGVFVGIPPLTGTSQSTAVHLNKVLRGECD